MYLKQMHTGTHNETQKKDIINIQSHKTYYGPLRRIKFLNLYETQPRDNDYHI